MNSASLLTIFDGMASCAAVVGVVYSFRVSRRESREVRERLLKEQGDVKSVVLGEEARPGIPARPGVNERLTSMERNIGGRFDTIEGKLNAAAILNGKGDQLVRQVNEVRETLVSQNASLTQGLSDLKDDVRLVSKNQIELVAGLRVDREAWRATLTDAGIVPPASDHLPEVGA